MSRLGTIARRTFLVGSTAVVGGVAFGAFAVVRPPQNPLARSVEEGETTFNPWVMISTTGITLISPHADKGQGVFSSQAALIAEEMDLEWGKFDVSFGTPSGAYWNRAMAAEAAPFMSRDESFGANAMRGVMTVAFKMLGMQGTGGSSTMPDSFVKLRAAGASARETLKKAASTKYSVAVADLKTENSAVILPDGKIVPYTELAEDAANIRPVGNVELRDPSQWKLISKDMLRLDIPPKSDGSIKYGVDVRLPGMKYAAVRTNPRQGGGMESYDASAAENMPGVEKIVPVNGGVAVIANNTWRAFKAVDAIEIQWGAAPFPPEQADHWKALEDSFTEDSLDQDALVIGDVAQAVQDGGQIVEVEYKAGYVAHQPLEPLSAIVQVTDEGADVWTGHQLQQFTEQQVAQVLGLDADQVLLHNQFIGGSFGLRLEFEHVKLAAEIAGQMKGTPILMTYSREEDFAHDFLRQITMSRATGVIENGEVKSFDLGIASVSAVASQSARMGLSVPGPDSQIPAGASSLPYAIPNFRVQAFRAPELAPTSSWRSVGASTAGFFADSSLDELLIVAGQDPMQGRLDLMNHAPYKAVLQAAAEMSDWGSDLGPNRGRGVAFVESFGVPVAEVVEVTNTPQGIRIDKVYVALDVGPVIDPVNFDNLVQGGVIWGLGHAMNCEVTFSDGMAQQTNFHAHEGMRLHQCPEIVVQAVQQGSKIRGVGEPPVPPAPAALANAIFDATGQRVRELPMHHHVKFV